MIQSISSAHGAAAAGDLGGQPAVARSADTIQAGAMHQIDQVRRSFGERLSRAASENEPLPIELLQQAGIPSTAVEPGEAIGLDGNFDRDTEVQQGLTPEQWLLAMIDQQLAEIQARDAAQLGGAATLPAEAQTTALEQAGQLLAWLPEPLPLPDLAAAQAASFVDPAGNGRQRALADAALVNNVLPRITAEMNTAAAQPLPITTMDAADVLSEPRLESLLSVAEPVEAGEPLAAAAERGQALPAQSIERALKLQAPEAKWGEQMLHALRENVDMQIQQKIQSASIRLDPPELGSLEILLSHESGRLNVQLSAANADVARLLQQTSDRLRQELVGQHFVQVNVQVGADSGGQQGQQRQRAALAGEELPIAARPHEQDQNQNPNAAGPRDVLITV